MLDFQKQQEALSQAIRRGEKGDCPEGIEPTRLQAYQEGFLLGIDEIVSRCFPILKSLCSQGDWDNLVARFYEKHPMNTPYFHEIPDAFLAFLLEQETLEQSYYSELAHFEWMELVLEVATEALPPNKAQMSAKATLNLSPLCYVLAYHYPVHLITQEWQPQDEAITYLALYRDREDALGHLVLNDVSARLLHLLQASPMAATQLLTTLANEMNHPCVEDFIKQNRTLIDKLWHLDILLVD